MLQQGGTRRMCLPSRALLYNSLLDCAKKEDLEAGRKAHCLLAQYGLESDPFFGAHLIRMFASCGSLVEACQVFCKLSEKNVFTWGTIILAHVKPGRNTDAIKLYSYMLDTGAQPDGHVFVAALKACGSSDSLVAGRVIHNHTIESNVAHSRHVASCLIDMYAKCASLESARRVFNMLTKKDVVIWNALIAGCVQCGAYDEVLQLFQQSIQGNLKLDMVTFTSAMKACSHSRSFLLGKVIHAYIIEACNELELSVGNATIEMYAKSGDVSSAYHVFERLSSRDVVSWGTIIMEYTEDGQEHEALGLFMKMQAERVIPDGALFKCVLKACSSTGALHYGRLIHAYIFETVLVLKCITGIDNTLIDMYAKCGSLEDARLVFNKLLNRDMATWNAMIGGCAHCNSNLAFQYFKDLQCEGFRPNEITFICLLCACNHLQLVDVGCHHFNSMWANFSITPTQEHYNCVVDLLGYAGHLNHAEDILLSAPSGLDVAGLMSLLFHCRNHGQVELAKRCFERLISLDERKASGYIHMLQLNSQDSFLCEVDAFEELRKSTNAWKKPGVAFIEIDHQLHYFHVAGTEFSHNNDFEVIYKGLRLHLEREGHMPQLDSVLQTMLNDNMNYGSAGVLGMV